MSRIDFNLAWRGRVFFKDLVRRVILPSEKPDIHRPCMSIMDLMAAHVIADLKNRYMIKVEILHK